MKPANILLIGIGGVGSVIAKLLRSEAWVGSVLCATKNIARSRKYLSTKHKKLSWTKLDAASATQLEQAAKGKNLIINASSPEFNEKLMQTASV